MSGHYDIDSLLDEVVTLPSLPETVVRVSRMVEDPACRLKDVASTISADPSLALKTLRLVNSAYYGLGQQVTTLEHAVVLLGVKVIKNLALTATVFDTFQNGTALFLRHSVACAMAMRAITERADTAVAKHITSDEAFVYGLLHDVGKIILQEYLPDAAGEVRVMLKGGSCSWYEAERKIMGVDHAQMGARLAGKWKLSPSLATAIHAHHDLSRCTDDAGRVLAATLTIADYICGACGLHSWENACYEIPDEVWQLAGITGGRVPEILDIFFRDYPALDELVALAA